MNIGEILIWESTNLLLLIHLVIGLAAGSMDVQFSRSMIGVSLRPSTRRTPPNSSKGLSFVETVEDQVSKFPGLAR